MSLQLTELVDTIAPFPADKNVRVLISGLALCRFNVNVSNIRFLRHVPHHDLIMEIIQIRKSDKAETTLRTITLNKTQNVEISASGSTPPGNVVYNPDLRYLIGMKSLHGIGSNIGDKNTLPNDRPSFLKLYHCAFYTHKRTDKRFVFTHCDGNRHGDPENFCEYLGGYMNYTGNLIIAVDQLQGSPLTYPIDGFWYQIKFTNHCDQTPACKDKEDFRFNYDILEDKNDPDRKYCLVEDTSWNDKPGILTPDTGACLPVCEDC